MVSNYKLYIALSVAFIIWQPNVMWTQMLQQSIDKSIAVQSIDPNKKLDGSDISNTTTDRYTQKKQEKSTFSPLSAKTQQMSDDLTCLQERYKTGIELIKLLYEKTLDLEHHFTGLHLHQSIARMTNPHEYPQFKEAQKEIQLKQKKNLNVSLPAMLESNPFIAVTYAIMGIVVGNMNGSEKKERLNRLACVMDFTLRMRTDLQNITYETESLKDANILLKSACERLFEDYARPIGYSNSLVTCREQDDWEKLENALEDYINQNKKNVMGESAEEMKELKRCQINLQFSIDRLLDFVGQYNQFTNNGALNYRKFGKILNGYEQPPCITELPLTFGDIKAQIEKSISLFENAYKMPELKGFKRKLLMYCNK
jgi:hypothetical protein